MVNMILKSRKWLNIWMVIGFSITSIIGCASPETPISATPTNSLSKTSTPLVTPQVTFTPVIPKATSNPTPITVFESTSPDSRWDAITSRVIVAGEERSILTVSNDDGKIEWEAENKPFVEDPPSGFWFPVPFHWSKDGKYLYYAHRASGDGCFGGNKYLGSDLQRLNLATGKVEDVSSGGTYVSISPDEKYLATFAYAKEGIHIQNIISGNEETFDLIIRQEDVGFPIDQKYITWSPDSKSLVFVVLGGVCDIQESYFNWVVRVDIEAHTQQLLTQKDEQRLVPISWVEQDKILTRDKDGKLWWMNPNTGAISSIK